LLGTAGFDVRYVDVDDHYPMPTWKTDTRVAVYRAVRRLTGANLGEAMVVVAELRGVS
jgi:hypothetical protein